jgi:uncharacterized protein with HEPN domain
VNKDEAFIGHILKETQFILTHCKGLDIEDLMNDETLQRACLRSLEIIGEATKNLSEGFKKRHKEIVWKNIAGLRDKLVHHYFGVDWEIVWDVITNKLPILKKQIMMINKPDIQRKKRTRL